MKDTDHTLRLTKAEIEGMLKLLVDEQAEVVSCVIRKSGNADRPLQLIAFDVR